MANHTRAKAAGWSTGEVITAAQINHIDETIVKCINAAEGSTHTPTNQVRLEGSAGMHVDLMSMARHVVAVQAVPETGNQSLDVSSYGVFHNLAGDEVTTAVDWTLTDGTNGQIVWVEANVAQTSPGGDVTIKGKIGGSGQSATLAEVEQAGSGVAVIGLAWLANGWRVISAQAFAGASQGSGKPTVKVYGTTV